MIRIKALRLERGWSGLEFARRSGLSPSTISLCEHGRLRAYDSQLEKARITLGWDGDPAALLDDVTA